MTDTDGVGVWPNVSSWIRDESRSRSRSRHYSHVTRLHLSLVALIVEHWPQTSCLHLALSSAAAYTSFSICTSNLLSAFLSPHLFTRCSLVFLFLYGLSVSTVVLVWQRCHHFISVCIQASFIFFFLPGPETDSGQFFYL